MKTQVNQILIAAVALAVFALAPAAIKADPFFVGGVSPLNVAQGSSRAFVASAANTGPPRLFLNGLTINFSGPAGITFSDAPFFAIFPRFLDPGQSTGFVNFFDVNVSLSVPVGLYSGSFSVLGGDNNLAQNVLGTAAFSVFVVGAGQPLPEPATMFLLATGLGGAAALTRRRAKRKGKTEAGI